MKNRAPGHLRVRRTLLLELCEMLGRRLTGIGRCVGWRRRVRTLLWERDVQEETAAAGAFDHGPLAIPTVDRRLGDGELPPHDQARGDRSFEDAVGFRFALRSRDLLLRVGFALQDLILFLQSDLAGLHLGIDRVDHALRRAGDADETELSDLDSERLDLILKLLSHLLEERAVVAHDLLDRVLAGDLVEFVAGDIVQKAVGEGREIVGAEFHVERRHLGRVELVAQGDVDADGHGVLGGECDLLVLAVLALVRVPGPDGGLIEGRVLEHLRGRWVVEHPPGGERDLMHATVVACHGGDDADMTDADTAGAACVGDPGREGGDQDGCRERTAVLGHVLLLRLGDLFTDRIDDGSAEGDVAGQQGQQDHDAENDGDRTGLVEQAGCSREDPRSDEEQGQGQRHADPEFH